MRWGSAKGRRQGRDRCCRREEAVRKKVASRGGPNRKSDWRIARRGSETRVKHRSLRAETSRGGGRRFAERARLKFGERGRGLFWAENAIFELKKLGRGGGRDTLSRGRVGNGATCMGRDVSSFSEIGKEIAFAPEPGLTSPPTGVIVPPDGAKMKRRGDNTTGIVAPPREIMKLETAETALHSPTEGVSLKAAANKLIKLESIADPRGGGRGGIRGEGEGRAEGIDLMPYRRRQEMRDEASTLTTPQVANVLWGVTMGAGELKRGKVIGMILKSFPRRKEEALEEKESTINMTVRTDIKAIGEGKLTMESVGVVEKFGAEPHSHDMA